tara:strand:+ start:53 stop:358 length:306 start_codon:yes stop_codon:yes gene_type:complete
MDEGNKKELAKKMATQRAKATGRKPLGGAAPSGAERANSLSFCCGEGDGFAMSPKTILLFSVAYMGFVILLHIFGKVSSIKKGGDPTKVDDAGFNETAGDL